MNKKRLVACFDVIGGNVTKAKQFQDNIYVAPAAEMAKRMSEEGIDEVIFFDVTASAERRMIDLDTVRAVKKHITVPFIVGGGLRGLDDMRAAVDAGADKVSIDSMAVRNPDIIAEGARELGSGRIVLSMQVKRVAKTDAIPSGYEIAIDGARTFTGMDALEWAKRGAALGAGEICVNSIDNDGGCEGYDLEITKAVAEAVNIPIIASGGAGLPRHVLDAFIKAGAEAAIVSSMLYSPRLAKNYTVREIKDELIAAGVDI
ncbi:MAG: imidazole glycerol phosphate synthase cyclase subunit [Oscillospiraceae bacterium]|jgi:cyclase|nr:imidazole glycerol phosphate synthase cyclase subunit [Oscillospiraceae bacterium]